MKINKLFIIVMMLMLSSIKVHAADSLWRIMHDDKDQDAVIVGTIFNFKNNIYSVYVHDIISGSLEEKVIEVNGNFNYYGFKSKDFFPDKGDFCILSLKNKKGNLYNIAYGAYKANSNNYETLEIYFNEYGKSDTSAMQYYINSKGKEKEYSFSGDKVYAVLSTNEQVDITEYSVRYTRDNDIKDSTEAMKLYEKDDGKNTIYLLGIYVLVISIIILYKKKE